MRLRTFLVIITIFVFAATAILWSSGMRVPDRWNPLAPIDLASAPNFLTAHKLKRLEEQPERCQALLARAGFDYRPVPDRTVRPGCGFRNAVHIAGSDISYGSEFTASCPLAVGLSLFERHVLQPATRRSFGKRVVGIDHYGTYACRNVNHREDGPRSEHATANAIDISAFRLSDGQRITVRGNWKDSGPEGIFLRRVRDGACQIFRGVLGPAYDASHEDHFHLDMGRYSTCR